MNLRSIHRWAVKPIAIISICIVILISNLNFLRAAPVPCSSIDFTGIEMFRGVFFSSGAYADLIPELYEFKLTNFTTNQQELTNATTIENNIINEIARQTPGYFDNFRTALLTRNPLTIHDAILAGRQRMLSSISALGIDRDFNEETRMVNELSRRIDISKASAADIAAAIKSYDSGQGSYDNYANRIYKHIYFVTIIIWYDIYESEAGGTSMKMQGLYFDQLVNSIAGH